MELPDLRTDPPQGNPFSVLSDLDDGSQEEGPASIETMPVQEPTSMKVQSPCQCHTVIVSQRPAQRVTKVAGQRPAQQAIEDEALIATVTAGSAHQRATELLVTGSPNRRRTLGLQ